MSSNNTASQGLGLATILTLIFVCLKLTDNIAWSWWWVLSPLWIDLLLALSILAIVGLCYLPGWIAAARRRRKRMDEGVAAATKWAQEYRGRK